eukprot:6240196-Pyramimonas_sp.AAC.1
MSQTKFQALQNSVFREGHLFEDVSSETLVLLTAMSRRFQCCEDVSSKTAVLGDPRTNDNLQPDRTRTGSVLLCPGLMRYPTFSICAAQVCRGVHAFARA